MLTKTAETVESLKQRVEELRSAEAEVETLKKEVSEARRRDV